MKKVKIIVCFSIYFNPRNENHENHNTFVQLPTNPHFLLRQSCRAPHGNWCRCVRQEVSRAGKRSTEHGRDLRPRSLAVKVHLSREAFLVQRHARRATGNKRHRRLRKIMHPTHECKTDRSQTRLCHAHEHAKRHGLHLFLHGLDLIISLTCNGSQTGDGTKFRK